MSEQVEQTTTTTTTWEYHDAYEQLALQMGYSEDLNPRERDDILEEASWELEDTLEPAHP